MLVDPMSDYVQIFTTTDNRLTATKISRTLVTQRLAACVQVLGPVSSFYRWKGRHVNAKEWLVVAKTRAALYKKAESAIKKVHNYKVPEILALPVLDGNKDYLRWLDREVE